MTRNTRPAAVLQSPLSLFLEWLQRVTRTSPPRLPRWPTRSPSLPAARCPPASTAATSTSRASEEASRPAPARHANATARPATRAQPTPRRLSLPRKTLRTDHALKTPDHTHTSEFKVLFLVFCFILRVQFTLMCSLRAFQIGPP